MKLALQVFAGVLLALLVFEGFRRYQAQRDLEDATAALVQFSQGLGLPEPLRPPGPAQIQRSASQIKDAAQDFAKRARWQAETRLSMQHWQDQQRELALRLKPGEECLGGFDGQPGTIVVRSAVSGVPQAVQLLEHGRPVKCVGDHRIQ